MWFVLWPTLQAFQFSLTDWNGLSADFDWVGLDNYQGLATNDSVFRRAVGNSLSFMLVVVIGQTVLSLALALALLRSSRLSIVLRALFFFPTVLSSVSVAFIWSFVYDPTFGLANRLLAAVGLGSLQQPWLGDQDMAIYYLAFVQIWFHAGQMMVVYIAGLQQIPQDLYDAAALDGAGRWQKFRFVTLPLVQPATVIVVAYTTIQSFKAFDLIIASTGGGPNHATEILATLIYTTAFRNFEMGYAAAQSVIFMIVIAVITILQRRAVALASGGSDR
ncbi:MAG: sugar ABC transporter permease [Actinomycetales bacterium]|nr:sugar ABC transporter permease [Actinomycetales bacterium]